MGRIFKAAIAIQYPCITDQNVDFAGYASGDLFHISLGGNIEPKKADRRIVTGKRNQVMGFHNITGAGNDMIAAFVSLFCHLKANAAICASDQQGF